MLRIKEVAKSKGISLTEIANELGISKVSLSYTLKTSNPTLETLTKIAKVLDVDVRDLIEPTKENQSQTLYVKDVDGSIIEVGTLQVGNLPKSNTPPTANDNTQTSTEV